MVYCTSSVVVEVVIWGASGGRVSRLEFLGVLNCSFMSLTNEFRNTHIETWRNCSGESQWFNIWYKSQSLWSNWWWANSNSPKVFLLSTNSSKLRRNFSRACVIIADCSSDSSNHATRDSRVISPSNEPNSLRDFIVSGVSSVWGAGRDVAARLPAKLWNRAFVSSGLDSSPRAPSRRLMGDPAIGNERDFSPNNPGLFKFIEHAAGTCSNWMPLCEFYRFRNKTSRWTFKLQVVWVW